MYIANNRHKNYISIWLGLMFCIISLMIIIGGATRLTDSGLSITKWELFKGFLPPFTKLEWENYFDQYKLIPEFTQQNYFMTLEEFKVIFWWEWIHRFLGRVIGILFIIPLIFFSLKVGFKNLTNLYLIFILICFQGLIGWYMVQSGLTERIDVSHYRLSLHLVIAFVILSLVFWNFLNTKNLHLPEKKINQYLPILFLFLLFCQIILGAFVSGMDAGKIYNTWPLMGLNYYPDDNSINNLININSFNEPSIVQFLHRNLAYVILLFYLFILIKIYRNKYSALYFIINLIGFFLLIQIFLGILTLISGVKIVYASLHQISSIFLVSSSLYLLYLNVEKQS
ncbi:MAG: hypothetical protein CBE33_00755 [Candidatus Pelagibacter sp. TMED273]|nr:MAG: hypothetical protein CBE33_00755 [Candidatus Pelagibacter sp. TMED273]